jgi:hypothetical protein
VGIGIAVFAEGDEPRSFGREEEGEVMGNKQVSIRTLPDGSRVYHHPDGKQFLIREHSPLRERLNARHTTDKARHALLKAKHKVRVAAKKRRMMAKGVPPEKQHI